MKQSIIIAVLFWAIAGIIICFSILSTSSVIADADFDTANTLTEIGNATPTVTITSYDENIILTEDGTSTIAWATSTITDDNGCSEISDVYATFYDDNAVNDDCTSEGKNCYTIASTTCAVIGGTCTGGGDTIATYSCYVNLWHYSNASDDWTWHIQAYDGTATGTDTSGTSSIGSLIALNVQESSIDYETLALDTESVEKSVTIENTGNKNNTDIGIKESTAFDCTSGTISPSYQHYSTTTSFSYGDGTALTSGVESLDTNISQGSDSSAKPTSVVYWLLKTPADGISGTCQGTNYFEAQ